jgi:hypothetical protein
MSDEEDDELTKWRKERGIPDEEIQRLFSPELRTIYLFEKLSRRVDENDEEARRRTEDIQRNMEFIVRQQAQFATDLQHLREIQERSEQRWERTEESVRSLHAIAQIHEREITALAEAQTRTSTQMAETDERINALVNTVERIISERRNGDGRES